MLESLAQFGGIGEIAILVVFVLIAILVLIFIVRAVIWLLPAAIVAVIVWYITKSTLLTGIAFLAVALVSLVRRP